ncbi:MAG TPA: DUF420 domain-containing protein [Lacipirellulaceae bacterium]|nr:DUF420 domain-containing protein [Lacipirellulaceae bacterium]
MTVLFAAHAIVHVNASLNALATVLLLVGLYLIKKGRVEAHKRAMMAAFAVSIAFLSCYVWKDLHYGIDRFTHPGAVHYAYDVILASHVLLAMTVPVLATYQIYLGFRALGCCSTQMDQIERQATAARYREKHIRLARIVFPIWLYVSVTGVIIYLMLYHLWPPLPK